MRYSKSWTEAYLEVQEQTGVRKVDFVDGITPDLQEAKPEFEVKYASSKKGPIKVSKFMSLEDAKKFLAQVKKEGMNGIISKGGKPVKEELDDEDKPVVKKVVKMLKKASQAHAGQADDLEKSMKEEDKIDEHCGECGAMDHVEESDKAMMMKLTTKAMKAMPNSPQQKELIKQVNVYRKKLGMKPMKEETINEADYELYHKTFSAAMQHAYAHAKKRGFIVDPDEIDNKVATGPKKPSSGKTNKYILGTNKKQKLHVQVANLDNKRYELNMYIEETEKENMNIEETIKQVVEGYHSKKKKTEDASNDKSDDGEGLDKVDPKAVKKKFKDRKDQDIDNDGDTDSTDKYLHKKRKAISKAIDKEEQKEATEADFSKKAMDSTTPADFASKKMKRAKEPQNETLLDKVKTMMKEKKYKK